MQDVCIESVESESAESESNEPRVLCRSKITSMFALTLLPQPFWHKWLKLLQSISVSLAIVALLLAQHPATWGRTAKHS